ncbi:monooxygenase [Chryseobacterium nematophagum]|uniref:Monooxygenase n=1 Tax=Chryseobacterium nematophagum TaxID=2305228 RepID=A0A3M7TJT5_9FLAO|nr:FAD-dependent monooxygenase [Chryseobacterium nematophagum]RNA63538.1 monooxygenase [Chryseobacterium nematophagum]
MVKNNEASIGIIGKGIGGLSLALALERSGYQNIKLYEQSNVIEQSTQGAGIMLACNAMQVMKKLGLHDELTKEGNTLKRMNITNENLKVLSCINIEPFSALYNVNMVAIHREKLSHIINSKIECEEFLGKKLDKITLVDNRLNMLFKDSTEDEADIIIGADGIHSQVRNSYFSKVEMRDAGQLCWRGIANIEMPKYADELNEIWGKGKRFGFVKINSHQIYWYALVNQPYNVPITLSKLNYLFKDFHPDILDIINSTEESTIITRSIYDFKTLNKWYKHRVCLIGDAAHAMTPNLGQGACQAIEDAYVFSECLKRYECEQALAKFNEIRKNKASWVVERSRRIGKMSQLNDPIGIWLRNTLMSAIPPQFAHRDTKKMLDIYQYESTL